METASLEIIRGNHVAGRGSSALELVQRLAKTLASAEIQLEQQLQKALADLTAAEDRGSALTLRASEAEERADEAEQWLSRLHVRLEEEFVSANRVLARV